MNCCANSVSRATAGLNNFAANRDSAAGERSMAKK
jgi:hypothetical protein